MKKTTSDIIEKLFLTYPSIEAQRNSVEAANQLFIECAKNEGTVMTCGNGGSAADSEHIVGELMKGFNLKRELTAEQKARFEADTVGQAIAKTLQRAVRAISLCSQSALISAFANDVGAENVYAQQVFAYAQKPCDLLVCMTTSGNSVNVVNAAITAKACGIKSLAITGINGGEIEKYADVTIKLPSKLTYRVQELTVVLYHALCAAVENEMFSDNM